MINRFHLTLAWGIGLLALITGPLAAQMIRFGPPEKPATDIRSLDSFDMPVDREGGFTATFRNGSGKVWAGFRLTAGLSEGRPWIGEGAAFFAKREGGEKSLIFSQGGGTGIAPGDGFSLTGIGFQANRGGSIQVRPLDEPDLLMEEFQASRNIKPLFLYAESRMDRSGNGFKPAHRQRLQQLAREVTQKQMRALERVGRRFDRTLDLKWLRRQPGSALKDGLAMGQPARLKLGNREWEFRLFVVAVDEQAGELKVRLEARRPTGAGERHQAAFWVGFLDFPMIDNTRLSDDERCAVILRASDASKMRLSVLYFPAAGAARKDSPHEMKVARKLLENVRLAETGKPPRP